MVLSSNLLYSSYLDQIHQHSARHKTASAQQQAQLASCWTEKRVGRFVSRPFLVLNGDMDTLSEIINCERHAATDAEIFTPASNDKPAILFERLQIEQCVWPNASARYEQGAVPAIGRSFISQVISIPLPAGCVRVLLEGSEVNQFTCGFTRRRSEFITSQAAERQAEDGESLCDGKSFHVLIPPPALLVDSTNRSYSGSNFRTVVKYISPRPPKRAT